MATHPSLRQLPSNRAVKLNNSSCPYCGILLNTVESDEDQAVGKNFVPRGKLDGQWNLILRACRKCNAEKGRLEDELSAISMQPDAFGDYAVDDSHLVKQARRKSRSVSSRTRKSVGKSIEEITFGTTGLPGFQFLFKMVGPPQASAERAYGLARFQMSAFFYWATFDPQNRIGRFWPGQFFPVVASPRSDWGNSLMRGFMNTVNTWWTRVGGITAGGFFKVALRRCPDQNCWSWALEWNQNYRLAGFCGDQAAANSIIASFETPKMRALEDQDGNIIRYREEIELSDNEDKMFVA